MAFESEEQNIFNSYWMDGYNKFFKTGYTLVDLRNFTIVQLMEMKLDWIIIRIMQKENEQS
jgi:hypothetical protein